MSFAALGYLLGLSAVVSALAITFLKRRRFQVVMFPSLDLLKQVARRKLRFQLRPHHYLLAAVRSLAIIFLCLGFARPAFEQGQEAKKTPLVIIIDDSLSMALGGAYQRCLDTVDTLLTRSDPRRHVHIYYFSGYEIRSDKVDQSLRERVRKHPRSQAGLSPWPVLRKTFSTIDAMTRKPEQVLMFTDLRENGWKNDPANVHNTETTLVVANCASSNVENARISVVSKAAITAGLEVDSIGVNYRVSNDGGQSVDALVSLYVGEREAKTQKRVLASRQNVTETIYSTIPAQARSVAGKIHLHYKNGKEDAFPGDDRGYFSVVLKQLSRAIVVEGRPSPTLYGNASYLVTQALKLIPQVAVESYTQSEFHTRDASELDGSVLFLLDPVFSDLRLAQRVRKWMAKGRPLFMTLGQHYTKSSFKAFAAALDFPVSSVDEVVKKQVQPFVFHSDHWFFESNAHLRVSDFVSTRFGILQNPIHQHHQPIFSLPEAGTLLSEWSGKKKGSGRILMYHGSFSRRASDFTIKPVFPVFIEAIWQAVTTQMVRSKSLMMVINDRPQAQVDANAIPGLDLNNFYWQKPGLYKGENGDIYAVNYDPDELVLRQLSNVHLQALFPGMQLTVVPIGEVSDKERFASLRSIGKKRDLTVYAVVLCLLFLAFETLVLSTRRFSKSAAGVLFLFTIAAGSEIEARASTSIFDGFNRSGALTNVLQTKRTDSLFHLAFLRPEAATSEPSLYTRADGLDNWLSILTNRTSIDSTTHTVTVTATASELFNHPFVVLRGSASTASFSDSEIVALQTYLRAGGFLFIDDTTPPTDLKMDFDRRIRRDMKRLFPNRRLQSFAADHAIYRSFYLVKVAVGRNAAFSRLEGIDVGGQPAVVYSRNNLLGAFDRRVPCHPDGERQREFAHRLAINLVMYVLTSDYKLDQIHLPELLKRTR